MKVFVLMMVLRLPVDPTTVPATEEFEYGVSVSNTLGTADKPNAAG
jgi:hypothetical protein